MLFIQSFFLRVDGIHQIKCWSIFKEEQYFCSLKTFFWILYSCNWKQLFPASGKGSFIKSFVTTTLSLSVWLRNWISNPGVPCSKLLGGFHLYEIDKMSTRNFWELSKLPPRSGSRGSWAPSIKREHKVFF